MGVFIGSLCVKIRGERERKRISRIDADVSLWVCGCVVFLNILVF